MTGYFNFGGSGFGGSGFGGSGFGGSGFGGSGFGGSGFGDSGFGGSGFGDSGFGSSTFEGSSFGDSIFGGSRFRAAGYKGYGRRRHDLETPEFAAFASVASDLGGQTLPLSDPISNLCSTPNDICSSNPKSGSIFNKPQLIAQRAIFGELPNSEHAVFASGLLQGSDVSGVPEYSALSTVPNTAALLIPSMAASSRESSNDTLGFNLPLSFKYNFGFDQNQIHPSTFDLPHPKLDINVEAPFWNGKGGRFRYDCGFTLDPHADLLFSCTSKKFSYVSPAEKFLAGLSSRGELASRMSEQRAWAAFEIPGQSSSWIDINITRLHNHLPGENSDDCLACISGRLCLDGFGASFRHSWNSDAKTRAGCDVDLMTANKTCFVEHQQRMGRYGEARLKVQHKARSSNNRGGWSLSSLWNFLSL